VNALSRTDYHRDYHRRLYASRRQYPDAPLRVGGWCVYRGAEDLRPMRVLHVAGGVAKVERDGRRWEEPVVYVRGCRAPGEEP